MWGGTLFFVTIVLVVPGGRTILEEYAALTMARLAAQSPLSEIILASIVVIAVMLRLILRQGTLERPAVYRVTREVRGLSVADLEARAESTHAGITAIGSWRVTSFPALQQETPLWTSTRR
jgi:hypothetical protein